MQQPQQQQMMVVASIWEAMRIAAIAIAAFHRPKDRKAYAKIVGSMLYPGKDPEDAGKYFANCLDEHRAETLDPQEYLWLKRQAKRVGCHILHHFDCEESEYQVGNPVEPKDEAADIVARAESLLTSLQAAAAELTKAVAQIAPPPPMVR